MAHAYYLKWKGNENNTASTHILLYYLKSRLLDSMIEPTSMADAGMVCCVRIQAILLKGGNCSYKTKPLIAA